MIIIIIIDKLANHYIKHNLAQLSHVAALSSSSANVVKHIRSNIGNCDNNNSI